MRKYVIEDELNQPVIGPHVVLPHRKKEAGMIPVPSTPPIAEPDHLWFELEPYEPRLEIWQKLCVEAYCCGFLQYFELHVDPKKVEHDIFFEWADTAASSKVSVYLAPLEIPAGKAISQFGTSRIGGTPVDATRHFAPPPAALQNQLASFTDPPPPPKPPPPPLS